MILSGPARPKSDPEEEEGRTDGRTRTTSGSVRFDAWAFTPVGRSSAITGGRPALGPVGGSVSGPPAAVAACDSCYRLRDFTPADGAKLSETVDRAAGRAEMCLTTPPPSPPMHS